MTKRRLPRNVVPLMEFGRRRELQLSRQLNADLHPASGAGRTKGDMSFGDEDGPPTVLELKTVPGAASHTVKYETLMNTLRQAERIDGEALYVIEFDDIKLVGRVLRR